MSNSLNTKELQAITAKLAPIEMPAVPDWQPFIFLITTCVAVATAALFIYRIKNIRPKQSICDEALLELTRLQHQWQNGEIDQQNTAYCISTLLRIGFGLPQLTEAAPDTLAQHQSQWRSLVQQLTALRYQPNTQHALSAEHFALIEQWLKQRLASC